MLVLSRKSNEKIIIDDEIEITVVEISGDKVKLGINAPEEIEIHRQEVYEKIKQANIEAAGEKPSLEDLGNIKE
ncbi:MAG: carbon storage regulator CsrA [bacterium]